MLACFLWPLGGCTFNGFALLSVRLFTMVEFDHVWLDARAGFSLAVGIFFTRVNAHCFFGNELLQIELLRSVLILTPADEQPMRNVGDSVSVCRTTYVLYCLVHASLRRYFALWALVWATHGLPVYQAPMYRGCPCRDPLGCPPLPRQDGIGSRAPTVCGCASLVVVDMCWGHRAYTRSSDTPPRLVRSCC